MRPRFWWLIYDERIADLRTKLRSAQQHAFRTHLGNRRLADDNAKLTRANLQLSARVSELEQAARHGERVLTKATAELEESTAICKQLHREVRDKDAQIERQADLFGEYRRQIEDLKRRLRGDGWGEVVAAGLGADVLPEAGLLEPKRGGR